MENFVEIYKNAISSDDCKIIIDDIKVAVHHIAKAIDILEWDDE